MIFPFIFIKLINLLRFFLRKIFKKQKLKLAKKKPISKSDKSEKPALSSMLQKEG